MARPVPGKQPTIADVAREAGVSVPTVSRVLTGSTRVSPEREALVHAAIQKLGFRRNGAARALAAGSLPMVAIITSNTTRYGYASTIQGIEEAARAAGHMVMICVVETDDREVVEAAVDTALSQPIAGAVVLEYDPPGAAALAAVPDWVPLVALAAGSRTDDTVPHAYMDDRVGAAAATQYLLDLGHATVHHLAIPSAGRESSRLVGWREALEAAGAPVPPPVRAGWAPMSGYEAGLRLARDPDVTAVLCGNDELAMGVMRALQDNGRAVPGDVSVVGFDDHPLGSLWAPSLTTVRQDFVQLGREAVRLLGELRSGDGDVVSARLVPDLVVRASSGPHRSLRR
ncbi:LacI family DNA-binding transcriptional regulator [Cellulomonas endometrii]|uniref:LacI family DNA-binding transcriptional regulator n=1 Tax=Cellulomonas endometrii TaxID=3036301 RepID=UPI0024ACC84E|nr:LacI family DNA-binding transcriptional regulator [Cellulomonas endometrii]